MVLDGIDKKIIRMLIENSRRPIIEIGKSIGISGAAIHQRLKKLEKKNFITSSTIKVNTKVLGYNTLAFIGIFLEKATDNPVGTRHDLPGFSSIGSFINAIRSIPDAPLVL